MKKNCIFVLFFFLILSFLGCTDGNKESVVVSKQTATSIDFSSVITIGNHSYVPINIVDEPSDQNLLILGIINDFEEKYPELEITHWQIEKQQAAYATSPYIFGLWIDHKIK